MVKRWLITIGSFFVMQVVFILINGTILEPRLNDMGHRMTQFAGPKLEWFTLYEAVFLKVLTMTFILYIVATAVTDVVNFWRRQSNEDELDYYCSICARVTGRAAEC